MKTEYCFEVTLLTNDSSEMVVYATGEDIKDVYYKINDKTYNWKHVEIIKVERKQKLITGYSELKELNPKNFDCEQDISSSENV